MRTLSGLLVAGLLLASCLPDSPADEAASDELTIVSASGRHAFKIEIARTPETQARGLMFRRALASDAGMLFVYPANGPITMWMKNTYIPLDMLFINDTGRITHIAERTVPLSTEFIGSKGSVRAVLELNGGTASRLGIAKGDRVVSAVFTQR